MRQLLARPGILSTFGVHDVFSALVFQKAGCEALFMGGFGTTASMLGLPDLGFLTMTEMAEAVRRMTSRIAVPVIVDGDTGHGDTHNIQRTVREFEAAGAAGIILEDQVMPKRCGHFGNKQIVPRSEMLQRIRSACSARRNPDFVIFARTDARQVAGLDEAIARVNLCCEAGADFAFIEAPESVRELERIPREVRHPVLVNMLSGGITPVLRRTELEALGYKIVVCPVETLQVCGASLLRLAHLWQQEGKVDDWVLPQMTFKQLKQLLDVPSFLKEIQSSPIEVTPTPSVQNQTPSDNPNHGLHS
jgi:2-methylisocitrate lyase-like PEP mutase family enzyme